MPEGVEKFLRETRPLGISDRWAERFWVQKKGRHEDALAGAKAFKATADEYGIWTAGLDEEAVESIMSGKVWIADARPGHPAVLGFRGKFHDASVCPSVMVRLVAVLVQVLLSSEHAVENGFCFVMDAEGIGWNNFSLDAERIYMSLFTSLPVRLTRIVTLNPSLLMRAMMNLMWPFIGTKMRERMVLRTSEQLGEVLHPDQHPEYLGGAIPSSPEAVLARIRASYRPWVTEEQLAALAAERSGAAGSGAAATSSEASA
ncbi:hypothetical protein FNF27_02826 [Cafeteria roenbergensis]|uniref:CRAL-TRIO domain-containing protein n=1 Tax=Cafeteria roenbergensis TaxID=33653 RepID=A0A5A8EIK5_CAFRO|nr:hypothetical protein FNF27_02826 [Cafeteria roenbergensis]